MLYKYVTIRLFLLTTFLISSMHSFSYIDEQSALDGREQKKLYRKRRFLIFPTGSSIQLVQDFGITTRDYTLYMTTCVQFSLAWALPDKPSYPDAEDEGSMQDRLDKNTTKSNGKGEIHVSTIPPITSNNPQNATRSNFDLSNQTDTMEISEWKPVINKLHTVYPAMGKRSIRDDTLSYAEKFFLDHHRRTRHQLYENIEKFLFAKGYNGTECVLKTLCEVGQKRHENEPGSFLVEIVRVIFSLPIAQLQPVIHKRHIDYDIAHQMTSDCTAEFSQCPNSIWNSEFLIESNAIFS